MESLFLPVLWSSCNQAPLAFKAKCCGGSSSQCLTFRLWSLAWCSELSLPLENFCDIIILQSLGRLPGWYGIWLHCEGPPPTISWFLLYVFGCRTSFFGRIQSILSIVVQQLVVILVCLWEEVSSKSSYSATLSLFKSFHIIFIFPEKFKLEVSGILGFWVFFFFLPEVLLFWSSVLLKHVLFRNRPPSPIPIFHAPQLFCRHTVKED